LTALSLTIRPSLPRPPQAPPTQTKRLIYRHTTRSRNLQRRRAKSLAYQTRSWRGSAKIPRLQRSLIDDGTNVTSTSFLRAHGQSMRRTRICPRCSAKIPRAMPFSFHEPMAHQYAIWCCPWSIASDVRYLRRCKGGGTVTGSDRPGGSWEDARYPRVDSCCMTAQKTLGMHASGLIAGRTCRNYQYNPAVPPAVFEAV